VLGCTC